MSELIVFVFDNEDGAAEMRDELIRLQKQKLIELEDAAVVVRRQDGKVKVKQVTSLAGAGALGGAFWGMLIGLLIKFCSRKSVGKDGTETYCAPNDVGDAAMVCSGYP